MAKPDGMLRGCADRDLGKTRSRSRTRQTKISEFFEISSRHRCNFEMDVDFRYLIAAESLYQKLSLCPNCSTA